MLLVNDGETEPLVERLRPRHEVRVVSGLRAAVEALVQRVPDVIVSQLELPPYRGDVLLALVAREHPEVRRVLLTSASDVVDCLAGVAHVTLTAPDAEALLAAIGDQEATA